jgi:hypothetical protein
MVSCLFFAPTKSSNIEAGIVRQHFTGAFSSFSETAFGFLSGDGLVDERLFVDELDSKNSPPHDFEACVFQFQGSLLLNISDPSRPDMNNSNRLVFVQRP